MPSLFSATLLSAALSVSLGCSARAKQPAQNTPTPPEPACAKAAPRGFADPEAAFSAYAALLNRGDYCQAINAFDGESRVEVAISALRALLVAGAVASEGRAAYRAQLNAASERYGLGYKTDADISDAFARVLNDSADTPALERERAAAARDPERMYVDLMQRFVAASPGAMPAWQPALEAIEYEPLTARGTARRSDGQKLELLFKQTDHGWILTALRPAN